VTLMLLPYASERRPSRQPILTWLLLGVNIAVSLALFLGDRSGRWHSAQILLRFGLVPLQFHVWSLFTYPFLHDGWAHLLVNLFYLWLFGAGVEDAVGGWKTLLLYLAGGAVGGALEVFVMLRLPYLTNGSQPIVGASAACAGLVGLYAVRYYRERLTFVGLPFRPNVVVVVAIFLAIEMGFGLWSVFGGKTSDGVAHWAHIGGFVFGLGCAYLLRLEAQGQKDYLRMDAEKAMEKGAPGGAIKRWETLLAREPDNADARVELARAWMVLGDMDQVVTYTLQAVRQLFKQNRRLDAVRLFVEMRRAGMKTQVSERHTTALRSRTTTLVPELSTAELFALGNALEEAKEYEYASETLRAVTVRNPNAPEVETALLKVIGLYLKHLDRREEARVLLRLFFERYPGSPFHSRAEEYRLLAEESGNPD